MDDSKNLEAAACDPALEISSLRGSRPSPLPGRFDDLLEKPGCMLRGPGRREFEFTKWRPKKLDQVTGFEIRAGDTFGFKHWASYAATIVTEARL
jgi:hypothetical protein